MAFIASVPALHQARKTRSVCNVTMRASLSRRAALQLAALSVGVAFASEARAQIDLKELKEDVEAIKYEEEVTDVGPDAQAENIITQTKKKEEEPEFRQKEKELLKEEESKYDQMVAQELAEEAKIKAAFSKSGK